MASRPCSRSPALRAHVLVKALAGLRDALRDDFATRRNQFGDGVAGILDLPRHLLATLAEVGRQRSPVSFRVSLTSMARLAMASATPAPVSAMMRVTRSEPAVRLLVRSSLVRSRVSLT